MPTRCRSCSSAPAPCWPTTWYTKLFWVALVLKAYISDDLYVWTFGVALIAYPIFGLATMARRRSVRGFTPLQPAALTVMCLTWFTAVTSS